MISQDHILKFSNGHPESSQKNKDIRWTTQIPQIESVSNRVTNKVTNTKCHVQKNQDYSAITSLFLSIVGNEVKFNQGLWWTDWQEDKGITVPQ